MRVLIADDEAAARSRLRRLLAPETDLEVLADATDGLETVRLIEEMRPDLVFLDIEMPGLSGLDAIRSLPPECPVPLVIFVTGYDEHALNAFRVHALAYLLKPLDPEELACAIDRARRLHAYENPSPAPDSAAPADEAIARFARDYTPPLRQIVGRKQGRILLMPIAEIRHFALDQGILRAHTETESFWVNFQIGELEERLAAERFFRARREVLVNLDHVREIRPYFKSGLLLIMNDAADSEIIVSDRQVPQLRLRMPGL